MREIYDDMYHYDFSVRCHETFEQEVKLEDEDGNKIDLEGKTASAQVRPSPGNPILTAEMACEIDRQMGSITFRLTSAQTAEMTPGKYAYDLCLVEELENEELRKYLMGGRFTVLPSVTE